MIFNNSFIYKIILFFQEKNLRFTIQFFLWVHLLGHKYKKKGLAEFFSTTLGIKKFQAVN